MATNEKQPPDVGDLARQIMGAMIVREPVVPLAWATARREDGTPIYTVAIIMGTKNCDDFETALQAIRPAMKPVDTFDGTPGEPAGN